MPGKGTRIALAAAASAWLAAAPGAAGDPRGLADARAELDGASETGGSLSAAGRFYDGPPAYEASNDGARSLSFARAWRDVRWASGTDVWYGAAFYIPAAAAGGYANLLRWDNYVTEGPGGDVGGIELSRGMLSLMRSDYDGSNFARLVDRFPFPRDRWFWLEVHQRFSALPALATSEVYLDERRVGISLVANSRGRRIDNLRAGYVYVEGPPSKIYFDRLSIASERVGPRRG